MSAQKQPYDAGDQAQVGKRLRLDKIRLLRIDAGFKSLMATPEGRAYFYDLLSYTGVYRTSFDPSNAKTAFNEGIRNVGLRLIDDMNRLAPGSYMLMLTENNPTKQEESDV